MIFDESFNLDFQSSFNLPNTSLDFNSDFSFGEESVIISMLDFSLEFSNDYAN